METELLILLITFTTAFIFLLVILEVSGSINVGGEGGPFTNAIAAILRLFKPIV